MSNLIEVRLTEVNAFCSTENDRCSGAIRLELCAYFSTSFGNPTRLDYGTGHELSFVTFLLVLEKVKFLAPDGNDRAAVASHILPMYFATVRKLIKSYRLEPAGSHGVWSLDDYQCLPFLLGVAELIHVPMTTISPNDTLLCMDSVKSKRPQHVKTFAQQNMFVQALKFVKMMKKGAGFDETSPMLYQVL